MRIDLHCHTKYSDEPILWFMKKIGSAESYTEPLKLYETAMRRGMHGVTITDHNVIGGCLEILHLPNTMMGCEYTVHFPVDHCAVHLLAYGFTEAQHGELLELSENIYDWVEYVNAKGIPHICAHPLFGPNGKLTTEHVEQLALLFKFWEVNSDQNPDMNTVLRQLAERLSPEVIDRLANKHGIAPRGDEPWNKIWTSGTDCHSGLCLGTSYTEVPGADSIESFWQGMRAGRGSISVRPSKPQSFARNIYSISYQYYKNKSNFAKHINKDVGLRFVDRALIRDNNEREPWPSRLAYQWIAKNRSTKVRPGDSVFRIGRAKAEQRIRSDADYLRLLEEGADASGDLDVLFYRFVNDVGCELLRDLGGRVLDDFANGRLLQVFQSVASFGFLYTLLAPYVASFAHYATQRRFTLGVLDAFAGGSDGTASQHALDRPTRVAHFTDTFLEVNGVAKTMQQQLASAQRLGKDYRILTCLPGQRDDRPGLVAFEPLGQAEIPEYPEIKLLVPPLLEILEHCYTENYTHVHIATPGPVGVAGLAAARILRLPVSGTYHTAFPQYARVFTDDPFVEEIAWKLMLGFYNQLETVLVPSKATGDDLIGRGLDPAKIETYSRGVDTHRFAPSKKNSILQERFEIPANTRVLLYCGRVSREKNLHILTDAYRRLLDTGGNAVLVVVGDGPYRKAMQQALADTPAVFTGYLDGDDLPAVYASSDIFVFPSATDTFGNVILEAQACGVPCVVTDEGGPAENVAHGTTGFVVAAGDAEALCGATRGLLADEDLRQRMGQAGLAAMANRGFDQAFAQLYERYVRSSTPADPLPDAPGTLGDALAAEFAS